jgi:hypothetical protein
MIILCCRLISRRLRLRTHPPNQPPVGAEPSQWSAPPLGIVRVANQTLFLHHVLISSQICSLSVMMIVFAHAEHGGCPY